ncbi:MAG: hypothetical protein WC571_05925 [Candidatus Omnitrophota bacterium]
MKKCLFISALIMAMFFANSYVWAADSCGAKNSCKCADCKCSMKCGC